MNKQFEKFKELIRAEKEKPKTSMNLGSMRCVMTNSGGRIEETLVYISFNKPFFVGKKFFSQMIESGFSGFGTMFDDDIDFEFSFPKEIYKEAKDFVDEIRCEE